MAAEANKTLKITKSNYIMTVRSSLSKTAKNAV